jgi:hypothetical protein
MPCKPRSSLLPLRITDTFTIQVMISLAANTAITGMSRLKTLRLHKNVVINSTFTGGDLGLHDQQIGQLTRIDHGKLSIVNGNIDWILQRGLMYKFPENVLVLLGDVVVVTSSGQQDRSMKPTLQLWISGFRGYGRHHTSLAGEPILLAENVSPRAGLTPGISIFSDTLADVIFTSSLEPSLSIVPTDQTEQDAILGHYYRAIESSIHRHDFIAVQIAASISQTFNIGFLTVCITFDMTTLEGSVTASAIDTPLGTSKFKSTGIAELSVDEGLTRTIVNVLIEDQRVSLEARSDTRYGSMRFEVKDMYLLSG